jgi:uncharacterized membrane protein
MTSKRLYLILSLAAALRLFDLGVAQFWYDEAFTLWVSRLPLSSMLAALAGDVHPPGWYLLTWVMVHLGVRSEFAFRLPSVVLSLAGIWLAWRIAVRLEWPAPATFVALALMAVNPLQIFFGQEARMYALFQAEILLCVLAVLERRWKLLAVASVAALYTHNYALIYLPLVGMMGVCLEMVRPVLVGVGEFDGGPFYHQGTYADSKWTTPLDACQLRQMAIAIGAAFLAWLPWALVLSGQMSTVAGGYWIQPLTPGELVEVIYILVAGLSMTKEMFIVSMLVVFGALTLTIWRVVAEPQERPARTLALVHLAAAPISTVALASVVWKPILLFRGLIPSAPFMYLLMGWAFTRIRRSYQVYALALVAPVLLTGVWAGYVHNPKGKTEYKGVVSQVREQWQPGDVVYHAASSTMVGWEVYAPDLPQFKAPACDTWEARGGLSTTTQRALGIRELPFSELAGYKRVWLVMAEGPLTNACIGEQFDPLIAQATPVKIIQDDEVSTSGVWLYVPGQSKKTKTDS